MDSNPSKIFTFMKIFYFRVKTVIYGSETLEMINGKVNKCIIILMVERI